MRFVVSLIVTSYLWPMKQPTVTVTVMCHKMLDTPVLAYTVAQRYIHALMHRWAFRVELVVCVKKLKKKPTACLKYVLLWHLFG